MHLLRLPFLRPREKRVPETGGDSASPHLLSPFLRLAAILISPFRHCVIACLASGRTAPSPSGIGLWYLPVQKAPPRLDSAFTREDLALGFFTPLLQPGIFEQIVFLFTRSLYSPHL